jgi:HK97 family phage prohead protease
MRKREFRKFKAEVRTQMVDGKEKIVGYGAVYNQLSQPMRVGNRTFRERVMPGAFDKCLRAGADIRGLINHDKNLILGRTTAGTMSVVSDGHGLRYEIDPPGTTYSDDLIKSMRRGDIDQSSFGFFVDDDDWKNTSDGLVRELIEVDCFDVSPVTYPAYEGASSGVEEVRAMFPDGIPESVEAAPNDISVNIDAALELINSEPTSEQRAAEAFFNEKEYDLDRSEAQRFIDQANALVGDLQAAIKEATKSITSTPELNERKKRYQELFVKK